MSITVPRTLQHHHGSHIRVSLGTRDVVEANRLKFKVVAAIKEKLAYERASLRPDGTLPQMRPKVTEEALRQDYLHALDQDKQGPQRGGVDETGAYEMTQANVVEDAAAEYAEGIETLHGLEAAQDAYKNITASGLTINELVPIWLSDSDAGNSTHEGHRRTIREFLKFNRRNDALPSSIKRSHVVAFIDDMGGLKSRQLDSKTIQKKLGSLRGFWDWMESKGHLPEGGSNPWTRHKVSVKHNQSTRPARAHYSDEDLLKLLRGNKKVHTWARSAYLTDLIVLALYSGARIEELCSMPLKKITKGDGYFLMQVTDAKTKAGNRQLAFTSKAPCEVIERRLASGAADGLLFPELKPGGLDKKLSQNAVKGFTRYRRACGVADGADFHSFRRAVITLLENKEVGKTLTARMVGHAVGTMAGDVYSAGAWIERIVDGFKKVVYSPEIEAAALECARRLARA